MHVRHIGHAGIAVDIASQHVVCDPWWNGPAFAGQWVPFPPPQPEPIDSSGVDIICLSHGHQDHLHVPTLRLLRRDALVLVPRLREPALRDFVRSLGFERVIELGHGRSREVAPGLVATAYILKDDSILVLEGGGRTLVNANNALHSVPRVVLEDLCDTIRARHPQIDALIAECGRSHWFAHGVRVTDDVGPDSAAIQQAAEDRFAAVAHRLAPRIALATQPSFLNLDDAAAATRRSQLELQALRAALRRNGALEITVHVLAPGDRMIDGRLRPAGGQLPHAESLSAALRGPFAIEIASRRQHRRIEPERLEAVARVLNENVRRRAGRVLRNGAAIACRIDLRDAPEISFWVHADARTGSVARCDRLRLAPLIMAMRFDVLEALALQDCGDEAVRLGGGAILQLRRRDLALAEPLVALLGRRPLPPTRAEALTAWLRDPQRSFEAWRRDRHVRRLVRRLGLALRFGDGRQVAGGDGLLGAADDRASAG